MEIKDYYLILKKNLWIIIVVTIVFAAIAYIMTVAAKPDYQSSVAIEVDRLPAQAQSEVNYYQYENYYSQQVSTFITSNLSDWMTSASTVAKIFETAGYPMPSGDVKSLAKVFTVRKTQGTSAVVDVSYSSKDKAQADKVISAVSQVIEQTVADYSKNDPSGKFSTKSDQPVTVAVPKQTTINTLIATFLGLLISLGIISIREALK